MTYLTRRTAWLPLSGLLALLLGCQRPTQPQAQTAAPIPGDDLEPIWNATLAVLRKHGFQPDRQDRAQGVISTLPTTSMQWGEFWRQDVADSYSFAEASLHTIQRRATVRFIHEKNWTVEVQVDVYRLNRAESQITTASSAFHAFSGVLPDTEGARSPQGDAEHQWVHLGRDGAMEERLLTRILASADTAPPAPSRSHD
jgi:hypothetical protein